MDATLIETMRNGLVLALLVSLPVVAAALAVGLAVGALQAATQIGDPTVAAVPRLLAVAGVLAVAGPWMGTHVVRFARAALETIAK